MCSSGFFVSDFRFKNHLANILYSRQIDFNDSENLKGRFYYECIEECFRQHCNDHQRRRRLSESSCQKGPIVPKVISKSNDSSFEKFRVEMFLIHTTRKSQGFSKLRTLKVAVIGLLFSGQITVDSVPNLRNEDKLLNPCCIV